MRNCRCRLLCSPILLSLLTPQKKPKPVTTFQKNCKTTAPISLSRRRVDFVSPAFLCVRAALSLAWANSAGDVSASNTTPGERLRVTRLEAEQDSKLGGTEFTRFKSVLVQTAVLSTPVSVYRCGGGSSRCARCALRCVWQQRLLKCALSAIQYVQ